MVVALCLSVVVNGGSERRASHQHVRRGLEATLGAGERTPSRRSAAAAGFQLVALHADAPIVGLAIAQRQALCQMLGVGSTSDVEAHGPCQEGFDLCVVPAAFVALVNLLGRHAGIAAAARLLGWRSWAEAVTCRKWCRWHRHNRRNRQRGMWIPANARGGCRQNRRNLAFVGYGGAPARVGGKFRPGACSPVDHSAPP